MGQLPGQDTVKGWDAYAGAETEQIEDLKEKIATTKLSAETKNLAEAVIDFAEGKAIVDGEATKSEPTE